MLDDFAKRDLLVRDLSKILLQPTNHDRVERVG